VSLLHGDEPAGRRAIEALLTEDPTVESPVELVVANERAAATGAKQVDEDLNRSFPGDPDADSHERRLAAEIWERVEGKRVVDLHTTVSTGLPLAITVGVDDAALELARRTGVPRLVDMGAVADGSLIGHLDAGIAVECGLRGTTEAAANAAAVVHNVLANEGVLPGEGTRSDPTVYRAFDAVEKGEEWRFAGTSFERVEPGEAFAETPDGSVRADRPFYPVLMSTDGYEEILGFRAERVDG